MNGYPTWVVRQITHKVAIERSQIQSTETIDTDEGEKQAS